MDSHVGFWMGGLFVHDGSYDKRIGLAGSNAYLLFHLYQIVTPTTFIFTFPYTHVDIHVQFYIWSVMFSLGNR